MFRQNQDMIRSNYICKSYDKSDKCEFEKQEINKEVKTDFSSESQIIKTEKSQSIVEKESKVNSETDKISQETIKENFPFPTFLKDQLEILTEMVDAIEEGYKYIILESGVGKSAIAATLANIYESSFILSDNEKFCRKCGFKLVDSEVKKATVISEDIPKTRCRSCNNMIDSNLRICPYCGSNPNSSSTYASSASKTNSSSSSDSDCWGCCGLIVVIVIILYIIGLIF